MVNLAGFSLQDEIYESKASLVYRGVRQADGLPVVLKVLRQDYPSLEEIKRYRQEYEILRSLHLSGVIRAYDQLPYQHTYVIVFEDFGGESLSHWMAQWPQLYCPMAIADFLELAIALAETLNQLHQAQIIHKDINPSNIVLNPATGQIKLIDFGIATQLSRTEPTLVSLSQLEGTLAYLSPEQTGRINREIDYRTDFYSLGVTFYELLTGRLPFASTDTLEMVHAHLAKTPMSPAEVNPSIAPVLSELVMKLLAKDPEERYQSAAGLKADLEKCWKALQSHGTISSFPLARQDFTGKLQIPRKLYGREVEVAQLLAAFERVAGGSEGVDRGKSRRAGEPVTDNPSAQSIHSSTHPPTSPTAPPAELLLVTGYSGIGKSSLIRELYRPITERRGYFISGKFDQYQRGVPYTAIVDAFAELVRQLLGEGETELQRWRDRILNAVGSNGQVILDVLPTIEHLIGPQPAIPELGPLETQNRFNYVFQNFIRACCSPNQPLTLFLDDLQWADTASLNLLQMVLTNGQMRHLLVLGAYRSNEVDPTHPLMTLVQSLTQANVRMQILTLKPLGVTHVGQLLADTVHQPVEAIAELSRLVMKKTTGNPFFVAQFLKALHHQGLLTFNPHQRCWQWNISHIQAAKFTDNVIDLMVADIRRLPASTQEVLKLAACIGTEFELPSLEMLATRPASTFLPDLAIATATGLLISSEAQDRYWQTNRYRFVHDRIQQAAYEMGSPEEHQQIHLRLGQWLWEQSSASHAHERLFEIVDHLNLGLLSDQQFTTFSGTERQQWAELNLTAGKKAQESMAYQAAIDYFQAGLTLLGPNAWKQADHLTLSLHEAAAETAYLMGNFAQMNDFIETALFYTAAPLDRVKNYDIKIQALASQGHLSEAVSTGLTVLAELGLNLPRKPSSKDRQSALCKLEALLGEWAFEKLLTRSATTNPHTLAVTRMLANIEAAAYISDPELVPILTYHLIEISLREGYTPASPFAYAIYGLLLSSRLNQIARGYQFGQLASRLLSRFPVSQFQAKVLFVLGGYIAVWKEPLEQNLHTLIAAYESGLEIGDFEFAGYALNTISIHVYFSGQSLGEVISQLQAYANNVQQIHQRVALGWLSTYLQAAMNLTGLTTEATLLTGPTHDESRLLAAAERHVNLTKLHHIYLNKLILCYLLGDYEQAVACGDQASAYIDTVLVVCRGMFYFYDALARLAISPRANASQYCPKQVNDNLVKLQNWATHAPMIFLHKVHLIKAEKARVLGQILEAEEDYERAIAGAKANGYQQDLALAYELAANFYRQRGRELSAKAYLKEAHYAYSLWGAKVKVNQLEAQFPEVFSHREVPPLHPDCKSTQPSLISGGMADQQLDLQAVFRATQEIASAIELPRLQSTLLKILLATAGAERGYLLLPSETKEGQTEWLIESVGYSQKADPRTDGISVEVFQRLPLSGYLPISLVNYVLRTQESVVLDNAIQFNDFSTDPYLRTHPIRSILCTPILQQGLCAGLVYLENNLTVGAFTPKRLEMVQLLAGQAAISLRNARLYAQLRDSKAQVRQREQQLKQFLDAIPVGISIFNNTGHFAYQNPKAQELQGRPASEEMTVDQLTEVFQVYKTGTDQPYPTAELPVVRALAGETIRLEDIELRRNGQKLPLEVSATPILNELGEVLYAIAAFDDITERRQAQTLLADYSRTLEAEVEERTEASTQQWNLLQTLVNHIPVMLVFYDPQGRIILVNRAVEAITGWSIAELSQSAWLELAYPNARDRQVALAHWEVADGLWLDSPIRCQDGHTIETTWAHIRLSDGRRIGIGQDISERKRLEESLRAQAEAEHLLATITQHIRQSLDLTEILTTTVVEVQRNLKADRALILKFCDDGVIRVMQATSSESYQLPKYLTELPDCAVKDCYKQCLQGQPRIFQDVSVNPCLSSLIGDLGVKSEVVAPIIYPSSHLKPERDAQIWGLLMVQACATPRQWQVSEADFLQQISDQLAIGIYQSDLYHQLQSELNERRQVEAALRQSEARLTAAQSIAHMGNWEMDIPSGAMLWSEQLFEIAGLSPQQEAPTYSEFLEICHPDDRSSVEQVIQTSLATAQPFLTVFRIYRPDHTFRYVESRGEPEVNDIGEVVRLLGTAQDISDRYEIDRMKDEFIGVVSHELRTPLTAIQSSFTILRSGLLENNPDQARKVLRIASNNSDRLVRLVNDILDLERLEKGQAELAIAPCSIADLVEQSVEALQPLAMEAHINLLWEPTAATVWADPDAIIQVLTNLLSNAIKFSDAEATIWIRAEIPNPKSQIPNLNFTSAPTASHLLIAVTDEGCGIPEDMLESVFEQFQQVDTADSRRKGGTGLGLAICRKIVEKHHGDIWVESQLDEGSTFYFTLPLALERESHESVTHRR